MQGENCLECSRFGVRRNKSYCYHGESYLEEDDMFVGVCGSFKPIPKSCVDCEQFAYVDMEDDDGDVIEKDCPYCEEVGDYLTDEYYDCDIPSWCDYQPEQRCRAAGIDLGCLSMLGGKSYNELLEKMKEPYWKTKKQVLGG